MALFLAIALGFKLWMVIDALRRRVHVIWYLVLAMPAGDLVYFFAVKLRDFNVRPEPALAEPAPEQRASAAALEREAELSPSFHNRVNAGFALLEEQQPERAAEHFERALRTHPKEREALYGLGLARLDLGDEEAAIEKLSQLADRSFAFDDYGAALALCEAQFRAGKLDEAFALLSEVIEDSGQMEHHLVLARYQLRAERKTEAQDTLRGALAEFEAQPDFERRRNGATATEARRLLRTLVSDEPAV